MKKKIKRNANPEEILQNLRDMIDEAEEILAQNSGPEQAERLSVLKEHIQEGFGRLRDYSNDVGGRVKGYYSDVGDRVKDYGDRMKGYYSDAEDRLRDTYEEIEDRLRDSVKSTDRSLRSHPYQMATVTFGLGIAIGALLRLAGRSR